MVVQHQPQVSTYMFTYVHVFTHTQSVHKHLSHTQMHKHTTHMKIKNNLSTLYIFTPILCSLYAAAGLAPTLAKLAPVSPHTSPECFLSLLPGASDSEDSLFFAPFLSHQAGGETLLFYFSLSCLAFTPDSHLISPEEG